MGQPHKSPSIPPKVLLPVLIVVILGIAVGGFFLLNSYIYNEKQGDDTDTVAVTNQVDVNLNANTNSDLPSCTELTKEEDCTNRVECYGIYGPSLCQEGTCTDDLVFKECSKNYRYSNCLFSGGTWNNEGETASTRCICPDGTTFTVQGYTCQEDEKVTAANNQESYLPDGVLDQYCPEGMFDDRDNVYDPYYPGSYYVNDGCRYNREDSILETDYWNKREQCANTLEEEIDQNEYNVINGCLYRDGVRVFEKTFHSQIEGGEFGETSPSVTGNKFGIGENADEWFRLEQGNRLTFFLRGAAGCGGCTFNGPYLTLNKQTAAVIEKGADWTMPYLPSLILSPDHTKAIQVTTSEYDQNQEEPLTGVMAKTEFFLYDFIDLERKKLVYEYPVTLGAFSCGDGCYPVNGLVTWLDNNRVSIQIFKVEAVDTGMSSDSNPLQDNDGNYIPDGDPVIVNI